MTTFKSIWEAFECGLNIGFKRWEAFELACINGWAGQDWERKREHLFDEIVGIFKQHGSKVESDLLFTVLEDRLNNDFNTHEEDGSTEWLSKFLVTLYRDCEKENYEGLLKMKAAHDESHPTPQVHALNDGDTDDEDDFHADTGLNTVSEQMNGLSMESADNVNNDTDVKEEAPVVAEEAPAVDADGWSTVTSKKNRRRRK